MEPMRQTEAAANKLQQFTEAFAHKLDRLFASSTYLDTIQLIKSSQGVNPSITADTANITIVTLANTANALGISVSLTCSDFITTEDKVSVKAKLVLTDTDTGEELLSVSDIGECSKNRTDSAFYRTAVTIAYKRVIEYMINTHCRHLFELEKILKSTSQVISPDTEFYKLKRQAFSQFQSELKSKMGSNGHDIGLALYQDLNNELVQLFKDKMFVDLLQPIVSNFYGKKSLILDFTKSNAEMMGEVFTNVLKKHNWSGRMDISDRFYAGSYTVCKAAIELKKDGIVMVHVEDIGEDFGKQEISDRTAATRAKKRALFRLAAKAALELNKISRRANELFTDNRYADLVNQEILNFFGKEKLERIAVDAAERVRCRAVVCRNLAVTEYLQHKGIA